MQFANKIKTIAGSIKQTLERYYYKLIISYQDIRWRKISLLTASILLVLSPMLIAAIYATKSHHQIIASKNAEYKEIENRYKVSILQYKETENRYKASINSTATDAAKLKDVIAIHEEVGNITPAAAKSLNHRLNQIIERSK